MNQLELFTLTHEQRADQWIAANPVAFSIFCRRALYYHSLDRVIGAKKIIEDLRWSEEQPENDQSGQFKYNNNYTATLARRAIERHSELKTILKTRRRRKENI